MGLDNPLHIAFLLIILLLVFGAKRLPEMGRSLGEGLRGFKDTMSGEVSHHMAAAEHADAAHPPATANVVTTQPQAIAAAPGQTVVAPVVQAPAAVPVVQAPATQQDPQVVAAARTLGAQRGVVETETERSIEREPELLRS